MSRQSLSLFQMILIFLAAILGTSCHPRQATPASETGTKPPGTLAAQPIHEIPFTFQQIESSGIQLKQAGPAQIQLWLDIPGEIEVNTDRIAHVVPRVSGVVREVRKGLGQPVQKGEIMAILESRELADSKSSYLAARQRVELAEANHGREEKLWREKISAEQDYIQARNILAEARIELETTRQKLKAIGYSAAELDTGAAPSSRDLTRYEMAAPLAGTIVEKHTDLGEVLREDTPGFKIADLSMVWANLDIQQRDFPRIQRGQTVIISAGPGLPDIRGQISYVEPMVSTDTRTAHARVVLANSDGRWRPGLFITGRVSVEEVLAPLAVPNDSLILFEGRPHIFIKTEKGFRAQPVSTGRSNESWTEILSGLNRGQTFASRGAFTLKSELDKPQAEE